MITEYSIKLQNRYLTKLILQIKKLTPIYRSLNKKALSWFIHFLLVTNINYSCKYRLISDSLIFNVIISIDIHKRSDASREGVISSNVWQPFLCTVSITAIKSK